MQVFESEVDNVMVEIRLALFEVEVSVCSIRDERAIISLE
jgi:hypothetical protein